MRIQMTKTLSLVCEWREYSPVPQNTKLLVQGIWAVILGFRGFFSLFPGPQLL